LGEAFASRDDSFVCNRKKFFSRAVPVKSKFAPVRTSAFLVFTSLISAAWVSFGQTPSATSAPSNWQLSPPFELERSPSSSALPVSTSQAPAATSRAPAVLPTRAQNTRNRNPGGKPPYVEGSVWIFSFIKTKPGLTDEYLQSIAASLKPVYEEEKKQRLILDYKIFTGDAAGDRDFDVLLMVEYPNMAALDAARERAEPIVDKIIGPTEKRRELAMKRSDTRDILATKTLREIRLK
jgi:hypothetical protein